MIFYLKEGAKHFMLIMTCPFCGKHAARVSITDHMADYICMSCGEKFIMKKVEE